MINSIIKSIVSDYGFSDGFSTEIENEINQLPNPLKSESDRVDYRQYEMVTIDGESAYDFDDAVGCFLSKDKNLIIVVAIADVSAYVGANTALERSALERGNSVYLPGKVLPMFPPFLSQKVFSFIPHKDCLSLCCEMEVKEGVIVRYRFTRGIVRSKARLSYSEAALMIDKKNTRFNINLLHQAASCFRQQRLKKGAMILERAEKICIISNNQVEIKKQNRNWAHYMIEELMIAANCCAADFLIYHRCPALHRIHSGPDIQKLAQLSVVLKNFGMTVPSSPVAADFSNILRQLQEKDEGLSEALLGVVLGTLGRAEYNPNTKIGHFGLSCQRYLHFTSPIRRYPDLLTHRLISSILTKQPYKASDLKTTAAHCTKMEVLADKAGWDCHQRLACLSAESYLGGEFEAYVSGISQIGFYVTINELSIDAMVKASSLSGYWCRDEENKSFVRKRDKYRFRMGDSIAVKIQSVLPQKGRVDVTLVRAP